MTVDEHAARIKTSMTDNEEFDRNIAALRMDREIDHAKSHEIAHKVLGYHIKKSKSRTEAINSIVETQRYEARNRARSRLIDKTKWI